MPQALSDDIRNRIAVEYVRMSTGTQDQSIELQRRAISAYAAMHGLEVIRSYADEGISGLTIKRRRGLQQLLKDVQSPDRDFGRILVYDVSRWGRFQQSDESAYYEHQCRMNGAEVTYVAEPFNNDSSLLGAVFKSIKRAMAAEYSRELAVKTRAGQEKVVRQGFSASHNPHLGYRRQVASPNLKRCIVLQPGERKAVSSDRILVVLGPAEEQRLVKRIFRLYTTTPITIKGIVRLLNWEGELTPIGSSFSESIIRSLLGNPIYIGQAVWGQTSSSLGMRVPAPPEQIVRTPHTIPPLVSQRTFDKAQKRLFLNQRDAPRSREQLLTELEEAVAKYPLMSANTLAGHGFASRQTYTNNFGSLGAAYRLIGHNPLRKCGNHISRTYQFSKRYVEEVANTLMDLGAEVSFNRKRRSVEINGWMLGVLVVMPSKQKRRLVWPIVRTRVDNCDLLLIVQVNARGRCLNCYLLPSNERWNFPGTLYGDPPSATKYRITDLECLALLRA